MAYHGKCGMRLQNLRCKRRREFVLAPPLETPYSIKGLGKNLPGFLTRLQWRAQVVRRPGRNLKISGRTAPPDADRAGATTKKNGYRRQRMPPPKALKDLLKSAAQGGPPDPFRRSIKTGSSTCPNFDPSDFAPNPATLFPAVAA